VKKNEGRIWKAVTFILLVALVVSLYAVHVQAAQSHMLSALTALQTAKAELQSAVHDKGGHRAKALSLVNSAIVEVNHGIRDGAGR